MLRFFGLFQERIWSLFFLHLTLQGIERILGRRLQPTHSSAKWAQQHPLRCFTLPVLILLTPAPPAAPQTLIECLHIGHQYESCSPPSFVYTDSQGLKANVWQRPHLMHFLQVRGVWDVGLTGARPVAWNVQASELWVSCVGAVDGWNGQVSGLWMVRLCRRIGCG